MGKMSKQTELPTVLLANWKLFDFLVTLPIATLPIFTAMRRCHSAIAIE